MSQNNNNQQPKQQGGKSQKGGSKHHNQKGGKSNKGGDKTLGQKGGKSQSGRGQGGGGQKGKSQKGGDTHDTQKGGKSHKGGGKDPSLKGGKKQNDDKTLPEVVVDITVVWKGCKDIGMDIDDNNVVTFVEPGSPASLAGVMRTMQILRVDGTDVSTPDDVKAAVAGSTSSEFQLRVQSGARMRGKVVRWGTGTPFGWISPEVPLFIAKGVMGPSAAVYVGNAFCASSNIDAKYKVQSLAVGQDVTFVAKSSKGKKKMKATDVRPVEGATELREYVPPVEVHAVRPGEDIGKRVKGAPSICMMHLGGKCTKALLASGKECDDGVHVENPYPVNDLNDKTANTLALVDAAKLKLLEDQVRSASGGKVRALKAWQLRNDSLEFRFRCAEYNMTQRHGKAPDMIDGFHGTEEKNVLSIATTGFDPFRRSRQIHGDGEYFAKDPNVSVSDIYTRGGGYMFVCKLILGEEGVDHTWKKTRGYYVIKQNNGHIQCLPQYLIQFQDTGDTELYRTLSAFATDEKAGEESLRRLGERQFGGERPCKGRIEGCMMAATSSQLWVGWLDPSLGTDAAVRADLCEFLKGCDVKQVIVERSSARVGAFVEFATSLTQAQVAELNTRPYGKEGHQISVDDTQPENPYTQHSKCPKLHGAAKFCRGWNLRGHDNWTEACSFKHEAASFPLASAELEYETLAEGSAKYVELADEVKAAGVGQVKCIRRVVNKVQEAAYEARRTYLNTKHGNVTEKELWHGTSCAVLDTVLKKSLQAPSDTNPSDSCPVSGKKGLSTTLCGTDCKHCTEPHKWDMCHMYGHGIYLADMAAKSHRYVRPHEGQHSLVRCRVNLGNPFMIDSKLKQKDGMHHMTRAEDPTEFLENNTHTWNTSKGHDSYFVKGMGGAAAASGRGVRNSEYVVFHPALVLPLYVVDYYAPLSLP